MNQRDASRKDWTAEAGSNGGPTIEEINSGSFQRIADAAEKMASGYDQLQRDRDMYKRLYEQAQAQLQHKRGSIAAYKAHLTILRRKLARTFR